MENCLVSVLMPVYNVDMYLKEAIDSILNQTYKNIELIIIDDCSTDNSRSIIESYNDSRIRAFYNNENLQQPRTRNKALKLAKGDYIANMDSDDISYTNRIEEQVKYMEMNSDVDICGCYYQTFGGKRKQIVKMPVIDEDCKVLSIVTSPVAHPSVMIRRDSIEKYTIQYDPNYKYSQDFELWSRLVFEGVKISNVPKVLLKYRENPTGVTYGHSNESQQYTERVISRNLSLLFDNCCNFNDIILNTSDINDLKKNINILLNLKSIHNKLGFSETQIEYIIYYLIKYLINRLKKIDIELLNILIFNIGINKLNLLWFLKIMIKSYMNY